MVSPRQSQRVGQQLGDVPYRQGIVLGRQAVFSRVRSISTTWAPHAFTTARGSSYTSA